ncbi:uncharacterized protein EV420DRAFT_95845 [Desarmillaria tabescens]|uniref:Uncharacterized protein n=1 Tax=Armillaria tabescens TaxID=1929756 RepID=A0AA39TU40_ARMTA|nr:uncharacterized protein EV420DRAFT_95845 [Desarmillaria tabescens]KAK0470202.1 hypothetical protein EV420DRAFT_95845 [Desarmillaria tabescens]
MKEYENNSPSTLLLYLDLVVEPQLMFLPQWLLKALWRVLCNQAGGLSPLKAILLLWRSFWRFFRRFSRTQDDGAPDKPPQHIPDQVSYLPQDIEPTARAMSLAVEDEPVPTVVCRSATLPYDPRFSCDMAPMSVASPSQTALEVETDLNPSNGHPPLHDSRLSSITQSPIESSLDSYARSNPSQLSQDTSGTVFNSAADAPLNPSHAHLPHARSTSGKGGLSSDSEAEMSAVVMPLPPTAAQHDGKNQDVSTLQKEHPFFVPIVPRMHPRVGSRPRNPHIPNVPWVAPLTTSFTLHGVPSDWSLHITPAGVRYYVHEKIFHASVNASSTSCSSLLRIFTYEDTALPEVLQELTGFLDNILSYMHTEGITLPPKVDLVLSFGPELEDGTHCCGYYFADHMHCSIFWLDGFDIGMLSKVERYNTSEPSHLAHAIEAEYWVHYRMFPCQEMTSDIIEEVNDFLIHCITETNFGFSAKHGFTLPELQQHFSIVNSIRSNPRSYSRPGSVCSIALIMDKRSLTRYMHFYGEPDPFFGNNNSDEQGHVLFKRFRTPLITLLSPLLFFAPDIHCTALHEICIDGISKTDWSAFTRKLSTEWQDFVINATVLLNANIAFLAIQSIDESSVNKGRSPAQIASYVSTIMSISSVTMGLLLLQKNRHKSRVYNCTSWDFLGIQDTDLGRRLGLETLAIMYSLPWALLMWAMIFFLAAFCLMCFTASSLSVRMIVGSALLAIGILLFWYLTISRKRYELRWYVRAHVHLVDAWYRLCWALSEYLAVIVDWMRRMPCIPSNDVEMAPMGSHTTASFVNDESTTCSHKTMSTSSYETALASSQATLSFYDTASMRSHTADVDV